MMTVTRDGFHKVGEYFFCALVLMHPTIVIGYCDVTVFPHPKTESIIALGDALVVASAATAVLRRNTNRIMTLITVKAISLGGAAVFRGIESSCRPPTYESFLGANNFPCAKSFLVNC